MGFLRIPAGSPVRNGGPALFYESNRRKQGERRTDGLSITSLSKTSVSSC